MSFSSRFVLLSAAVALTLVVMIPAVVAAPKGTPVPLTNSDTRVSVYGAEAAAGCETLQYDNDSPKYTWQTPDEYGDTMQYVRFTPKFACTLKTVYFWVHTPSLIGTPGARVSIYSVAGGFPDTVITYTDVPNASLAVWPTATAVDFSGLNLVLDGDFAVVLQRIGAEADSLFLIVDDGTSASGRSGEFYAPVDAWELLVDGWGTDFALFIRTDLCCGDPPVCTPGTPQPDWQYGGDFQRTFRSTAGVTSECQLSLEWASQGEAIGAGKNLSEFTNIVVHDTLGFLSFYNYLACYNLKTGDTLWTFRETGLLLMGDGLRTNVTVDDSLVYVGGGSFRAFSCVRIADGSLKWTRSVNTTPLGNGFTRFAPSVVVDSLIFVADEQELPGGNLWALNKYTGANTPAWAANPYVFSEGWVYNALTWSGDSLLFCGTTSSGSYLNNGRLYAIRVADGTTKWELEDPSAIYLDPVLDQEGYTGSLAYENGILYYQSNIRDDASGFDHFPWDGSAGAIDVLTEDGSGAGILWVCPSPIGRSLYGGPVIGEGVVYVNNDGIFTGASNPKGVIAINKSNGALLWHNPLDGGGVPMPLALTCEPAGSPYIFSGSRTGLWYLIDGFTGEVVWTRTFSGLVHGTAVVDSQVLVSTRSSLIGTTNGFLASFRITGLNRPRMDILQDAPYAVNALPGSGNTTVDTIQNALTNVGCAPLVISSFGVDTASLAARVTVAEPQFAARASRWADFMAPSYLSFITGFGYPTGPSMLDYKTGLLRSDIYDESTGLADPIRRWTETNIARAAAPQVVTIETAAPATVLVGESLSVAIRVNETGQIPRTTVRNYIAFGDNDPDFFPEDTAGATFGQPVIPVDAIFGYAFERDTMRALDAMTQVTNHGTYGEGDDSTFWVEGDATASMYDGGFLITGKLADTARTAWDVYDWAEFQPDTFLTIVRDTAIGTVTGLDTITASIATSKYIDSIGFPDSAVAYSFGLEVRDFQLGLNVVGQGIGSFKVIQHQIVNRNATPIDSVLYLGSFADWDVESGNNNVDTSMLAKWNCVYMYDPGANNSAYGIVKLPAPGAVYRELDGVTHTAGGFYSIYVVTNPDEVYPTGAFEPLVDHIHEYVSQPGVNTRSSLTQNDDLSLAVVLDTVHLGPNDTVWVRYALWGDASGNLNAAARDAAFGANLVSGFRRGDVNADGEYNFLDLVYLYRFVTAPSTNYRPIPRDLNGDVNADGLVDMADVNYLEAYLYGAGPAPVGGWWW